LRYHFRPKPTFFKNVASYISRKRYPLNDATLNNISRDIFGPREAQDFFPAMRNILEDMRVKVSPFPTLVGSPITLWIISQIVPEKLNPLVSLALNDYNNYGFEILMDISIYLPPVFTDLRKTDIKPLHELVLPVLKKTSGVFLKHKDDPDITFKMYIKRCHTSAIDLEMIRPIFPDCKEFKISQCLKAII
jgi:hypothetical protein